MTHDSSGKMNYIARKTKEESPRPKNLNEAYMRVVNLVLCKQTNASNIRCTGLAKVRATMCVYRFWRHCVTTETRQEYQGVVFRHALERAVETGSVPSGVIVAIVISLVVAVVVVAQVSKQKRERPCKKRYEDARTRWRSRERAIKLRCSPRCVAIPPFLFLQSAHDDRPVLPSKSRAMMLSMFSLSVSAIGPESRYVSRASHRTLCYGNDCRSS